MDQDLDTSASPDRTSTSPDHRAPSISPQPVTGASSAEMATMVASPTVPGPVGGVNKRYRPAPAKTFQCRGYGECRMVFSRSEHLARHIRCLSPRYRKHTGERPFSCHCGKQFSRLDNLRQHAQTVHADKQEQNERMMRELTSLHATMAAANKIGSSRGGRRAPPIATMQLTTSSSTSSAGSGGSPTSAVKQEDGMGLPMHHHPRPGTSTGYEGEMVYSSWKSGGSHSFRDPGQSFLVPPPSSTSSAAGVSAQSHSFRNYSAATNTNHAAAAAARPGSSASRPPTASGAAADAHHPRSLPPLAAVVSASLAASQQQQPQPQSLFPFLRRPSTATRPGTAPASASFFSRSLSALAKPDLGPFRDGISELGPVSPSHDPSPFYFSPPDPAPAATTTATAANPRKRPFGGPDGPHDDRVQVLREPVPPSAHPGELSYEYGSESRPQSRRLSVMELCNDDDADDQEHFYYQQQQQRQQQVAAMAQLQQQQAQQQAMAMARARQPLQDLSLPLQRSISLTAQARPPHQQQQQAQPLPSPTVQQQLHYSAELRMQQHAQLLEQRQMQILEVQAAQAAEEAELIQQYSVFQHQQQQQQAMHHLPLQHPHPPSHHQPSHHHHQQQQAAGYYSPHHLSEHHTHPGSTSTTHSPIHPHFPAHLHAPPSAPAQVSVHDLPPPSLPSQTTLGHTQTQGAPYSVMMQAHYHPHQRVVVVEEMHPHQLQLQHQHQLVMGGKGSLPLLTPPLGTE
ncbi:hypothetical protein CVT26_003410 [Gymnopilus dilepis]|uniref:C2H2-type domain-containing protein n=1 Tax=Gymnopilus dilepis TaxID=231916 RepID=A0A409Y5J1_9AGAR|nr:hypothetical protein CVT26_003410 [Gymnopilus dilepis]